MALVDLGGLYLLDSSGTPFKRARLAAGEGASLPVITGLAREQATSSPAVVRERLQTALAIIDLYRAEEARPPLGEVHLDPLRGVTLVLLEGGAALHLGDGELASMAARLRRFDKSWAILSDDERRLAASFHLNNSTHPERVSVALVDLK